MPVGPPEIGNLNGRTSAVNGGPQTPAPPANPTAALAHAKPGRWLGRLALALALLGWWLSIDLLRLTGGATATNPWLQAACGQASEDAGLSDCASVLRSRWARIQPRETPDGDAGRRIGLPWAALGAAYFAFVAVWYLFVGPPTRSRRGWHLVIMAVVAIGAYCSAYFIYVMGAVLHRWCAGCVAAHIVNGLIVLLTILAFPWRRASADPRPHPSRRLALATLLAGLAVAWLHLTETKLMVLASAAGQLQKQYAGIANDPEYARWRYDRQALQTIPLYEDELFAGNSDAPNTVVAFLDFQCPACKLAHEMLTRLAERHGDVVRVAYRHFPLDSACNPQFASGGHPAACRAAQASEAARLVGGAAAFTRMSALLYDRQRDLELDRFSQWAAEIGLDPAAFAAALESPAVAARIRSDVALGTRLGLKSTPTLFLNGRRVEHWRNPATWRALLGLEQAQATSRPAPAESQP